jgi:superfamily II DNA helicase RecQ
MDPAGGEALNLHTVRSAADWVVVEGAHNKLTVQAYTAFRQRILPLMPKVNQDGALNRAEPREGQIRSLYYLCEDGHDVILIAKTGFGKSVIFQLAPLLRPGICLIISPLNALSSGQLESLDALQEAGAKGLVVNQDNNNQETRRQAASGGFTHGIHAFSSLSNRVRLTSYVTVITSPEILNSRKFRQDVLQNEQFLGQLVLVAIDELHVAQQWATFREDYGQLHKVRARIPRSVPWFGTSATLDSHTLEAAKSAVGFENPITIRTSIDRPDIFYELREFEVKPKSFEDLHFLLPEKLTLEEALKLPKTIIYFKDTRSIRAVLRIMSHWLVDAGLSLTGAKSVVKPFYGKMSSRSKNKISADFRMENSKARILLATDAVGMGVGNRAVELVIQYDVDKIVTSSSEMKTIMQRLGRAARGQSENGHFIWLVPRYVFGPTMANDLDDNVPTTAEDEAMVEDNVVALNKTEASKHNAMADVFNRFFDPNRCTRQVLLDFFCEPANPNGAQPQRNERCCNKETCQPTYAWPSKQPKTPSERASDLEDLAQSWRNSDDLLKLPASQPPHGWPWVQGVFEEKLREWRQKEADDLFAELDWFTSCPELILPESVLKKLILMNNACSSVQIVNHFLPEWEYRHYYAEKIVELAQESSKVLKRDGRAKIKALKEQKKAAEKAAKEEEEKRQARLLARYSKEYPTQAGQAGQAGQTGRPRKNKAAGPRQARGKFAKGGTQEGQRESCDPVEVGERES